MVPLVSGTVTQVNYAVGDTVKEGDVLFRIDDEAAQLQMDNARAAYSQAQAGVNAATGGARHLQNYQTEQGIDSMEAVSYTHLDVYKRQEDIDEERAVKAKERAEKLLEDKSLSERDYRMAEARLKRALLRLDVKG